MVTGLKQVRRVSSGNLVPSHSTENHLLSLSELEDLFLCRLAKVQDCSLVFKSTI